MFSKTFASILLALVLASLTSAHFTLDSPPSRYFNEETETKFCGGSSTPSGKRKGFPLSGQTTIKITSHHEQAQVAILFSLNPNPSDLKAFKTKGKYNFLQNFKTIKGQKQFEFKVDLASLTNLSPAPKDGDLATIQVEFNGGDGILYQCTDVILKAKKPIPNGKASSH